MRNFIFGTDWYDDCDDAVALRILARAHKSGKINLKGVGINACMDCSVQALEGFLNQEGVHDIPIGIDAKATGINGNPVYQKRLSGFCSKYKSNSDAEDAVKLYRRILAESNEPVEIVEVGFLQVIAGVLESDPDDISAKPGLELVKEKVAKIWSMAGKWDEKNGLEYNIKFTEVSRNAADVLCRICPVPVTFLGFETGADIITGDNLDKDDFLYHVLCDHGSAGGRSSWDPLTAMLALIGDEVAAGYDVVCGTARVNPETGENNFTPSADGIHRYVVRRKEKEYYKKLINEAIK